MNTTNKPEVTKREVEIICELSRGLNSLEISEKFFISMYTVNTHRRNAMQKLEAKNTAHLIRRSFELGVLRSENL